MYVSKIISTASLVVLFSWATLAQTHQTEHTLTMDEGVTSPRAKIQNMAWITGEYECHAFGGLSHEIWTSPRGNNMMGAFQLIDKNNVSFYEIMTIVEEQGSLVLRLKHFDKKLHGWEEKDETIDFPLVKMEEKKAYFDGLTFEYVSRKAINVYVALDHDGSVEEVLFAYRKVRKRNRSIR